MLIKGVWLGTVLVLSSSALHSTATLFDGTFELKAVEHKTGISSVYTDLVQTTSASPPTASFPAYGAGFFPGLMKATRTPVAYAELRGRARQSCMYVLYYM